MTVSWLPGHAASPTECYIDRSKVSDEELEALAEDTAILAVSPHQKKLLTKPLNANGHTTVMTGDEVNDILALREADCSIVMAEGDLCNTSDCQLGKAYVDPEFKDIPEILFEGRCVVNNIAHIAATDFPSLNCLFFFCGLICITYCFLV